MLPMTDKERLQISLITTSTPSILVPDIKPMYRPSLIVREFTSFGLRIQKVVHTSQVSFRGASSRDVNFAS